MKKNILILINPVSGISNKQRLTELIRENIDTGSISFELQFTEYAGHGRELAARAAAEGKDAVIVVGGDGSVNEAAGALVNTNTAMGIIPTGSGNGLAHYLKLPFNLARAIAVINRFKTQKMDTYALNGQVGCNAAGVGFDGKIAHEFAKVKRRGFWSYFKIILHEYPRFEAGEYVLEINGQSIRRKALLVCFANSNQFGNGAVIAPDAKIDDGLIDVCIMSKVPLLEAPVMGQILLLKLINRTHYVEYFKASEVRLFQHQPHPAHIDGDPFEAGKELHLKVNPLSLHIIVP